MKYMILMKASADSEAGKMPTEAQMNEMGAFNEELVKSGVLLAGEGLGPSSMGARVKFTPGEKPVVQDGPFAETKELLAGFWILEVKSKEEAVAWASRIPNLTNETFEVEVRKVFGTEDFPQELPVIQREYELRDQVEAQNRAR